MPADLAAWSYRRELTINNMGLGAHTNFAVAVMLDATRVRYTSKGDDLRFTDATKALLPYEIDTWNQLDRSVVWVGVPEIAANATTTLWMYYGNADAPAAQRAAAVWDQDYVGVWHLTDAHDSTGRNNSTSVGATPLPGKVGGAVRVVGSGQYIDTGAADQLANWTIEVWMSAALPAATNNSSGPISRGYNYQMQWNCGDVEYCKSVNLVDQSGNVIAQYGNSLAAGVWHHVAARYDGAMLETYVGDMRTAAEPAAGPPNAETGTTKLGARVNLGGYYAGDIDEVRISRVARSADYLKAQHRAQADTYVTVGPELPNP